MRSRAFLPSAAFGCLLLAACSSSPFDGTSAFAHGYKAACTAVAAGIHPAPASDAAHASSDREFGAGWDSGLHCRDAGIRVFD